MQLHARLILDIRLRKLLNLLEIDKPNFQIQIIDSENNYLYDFKDTWIINVSREYIWEL